MTPVRVGAVSYLNARPLVEGLDTRRDLFETRFDVPAECAELLHAGAVDVGLIPAVEYQRGGADYRIVPGLGIGSRGATASVAVFSRVPVERIGSIALDTTSRTSVALTRVLCAKHWGIAPRFLPAAPGLDAMLASADAALLIGDLAFMIDPAATGTLKLDLGDEWLKMTGLPFVFAVWVGRAGALSPAHVTGLHEARDRGLRSIEAIAAREARGDAALGARFTRYLRDNLRYELGETEQAGLAAFHQAAADLHLVPEARELRFY